MQRYWSWAVLIVLSVAAGAWAYSVAPSDTVPRLVPAWSIAAKLGLAAAVAVGLFLLVRLVLLTLNRASGQARLWVICALLGWVTAGATLAVCLSLMQAVVMMYGEANLGTPQHWIWGRAAVAGLFFGLLAVGVLFGLSRWERVAGT